MDKKDLAGTYVSCKNWSFEDKLKYMKACIGDELPTSRICGWACNSFNKLMEIYEKCTFIYFDGKMLSQDSCETPVLINSRVEVTLDDLTPQTKDAEWVNGLPPVGEVCDALFINYNHKGYGKFLVLGYHSNYVWLEYVGELRNKSKHYTAKVDSVKFQKQETEAEKLERERLEVIDAMCWSVHSLKVSQASALYDAGYRKEK